MEKNHTQQIIDYLLQQNKKGKAEMESYHNLVNELAEDNKNSGYQLFASEDEQKGEMSVRIVVHTEYGPIIKTITRTPQVKKMTAGVVKLTYEGFVPDEYYMAYLASTGMNHTRYIKATASYGELVDYDDKGVESGARGFSDQLARIRITDGKYRCGKWRFENFDSTDACYNDFVGKYGIKYEDLFNQEIFQDFEQGIGRLLSLPTFDGIRFGIECAEPFWNMQHYFNREAQKAHVPTSLINDNIVRKPDLKNYSQEHEMKD